MPTTLTFRQTHRYADHGLTGITIPIVLSVGNKITRLLAKLDTGADRCYFRREHGEQLALNIEAGRHVTVYTAAGRFEAYGHEVTIKCFEWEIHSEVFFAQNLGFPRDVLGRHGWIQNFGLALIDHDSILHLSHYDQLK